jgi:hypothetical protein
MVQRPQMLDPLLSSPAPPYDHVVAIIEIAFLLVALGHCLLSLLRNLRDYWDGY